MATDLKDDATHEDIVAFAETAAKQVEEDRKGETVPKGDAQKIAEDQDDTPIAETKSGSDETAETGEKAGDSGDRADDWLDEDLKAEIAAYGIDEKELADFTSREEVERALRFFDRSALEAGRKALAEGHAGEVQARDGQGRFARKDKDPEPKSEPKEGQYEVSLDKDAYDEELIGEFTKLRDHYESRLEAIESRFAEVTAKMEEEAFDGYVDSLGHADLFGTTGKESAAQLQRRRDLHVTVKAQQVGLEMLGRPVDLDRSLVNRVAKMVFAEELDKKNLKARTQKLMKQHDARMGGGGTKAPGPAETIDEWAKRYYKELEGA